MGEIVYRIFYNWPGERLGNPPWTVVDADRVVARCWTVQEAIACLPPEHRS